MRGMKTYSFDIFVWNDSRVETRRGLNERRVLLHASQQTHPTRHMNSDSMALMGWDGSHVRGLKFGGHDFVLYRWKGWDESVMSLN